MSIARMDADYSEPDNPIAIILNLLAHVAQMTSITELNGIRDKAESARQYAKAAKLGFDIQNECAEAKIIVERRAGELLAEMVVAGERKQRGGTGSNQYKQKSHGATSATLSDIGVDKHQSRRWQAIAKIPKPVFDEAISSTKEAEKELTTAGVMRYYAEYISSKQKPDDDKDEDVSQYKSTASALAALWKSVMKVARRWLDGAVPSLTARLREYADEIEEKGIEWIPKV